MFRSSRDGRWEVWLTDPAGNDIPLFSNLEKAVSVDTGAMQARIHANVWNAPVTFEVVAADDPKVVLERRTYRPSPRPLEPRERRAKNPNMSEDCRSGGHEHDEGGCSGGDLCRCECHRVNEEGWAMIQARQRRQRQAKVARGPGGWVVDGRGRTKGRAVAKANPVTSRRRRPKRYGGLVVDEPRPYGDPGRQFIQYIVRDSGIVVGILTRLPPGGAYRWAFRANSPAIQQAFEAAGSWRGYTKTKTEALDLLQRALKAASPAGSRRNPSRALTKARREGWRIAHHLDIGAWDTKDWPTTKRIARIIARPYKREPLSAFTPEERKRVAKARVRGEVMSPPPLLPNGPSRVRPGTLGFVTKMHIPGLGMTVGVGGPRGGLVYVGWDVERGVLMEGVFAKDLVSAKTGKPVKKFREGLAVVFQPTPAAAMLYQNPKKAAKAERTSIRRMSTKMWGGTSLYGVVAGEVLGEVWYDRSSKRWYAGGQIASFPSKASAIAAVKAGQARNPSRASTKMRREAWREEQANRIAAASPTTWDQPAPSLYGLRTVRALVRHRSADDLAARATYPGSEGRYGTPPPGVSSKSTLIGRRTTREVARERLERTRAARKPRLPNGKAITLGESRARFVDRARFAEALKARGWTVGREAAYPPGKGPQTATTRYKLTPAGVCGQKLDRHGWVYVDQKVTYTDALRRLEG